MGAGCSCETCYWWWVAEFGERSWVSIEPEQTRDPEELPLSHFTATWWESNGNFLSGAAGRAEPGRHRIQALLSNMHPLQP